MKTIIFGLLLVTQASFAGVADFHSLITESLEAKKELSAQLKKNVNTVSGQQDLSSRQKVVIREEIETPVENIVAPSGKALSQVHASPDQQVQNIEHKKMKRLSQEIREAQ